MKIKQLFTSMLILGFLLLVSGCDNTINGFGKDMQENGQKIEKSVNNQ